MFTGDEYSYSGIEYRGISLASDHPAALNEPCHMIPEELLDEIDARDIRDFALDHYYFLLPNAKSIISSKAEYSYICIRDVSEEGVLIEISIHTESGWDDLLSPEPIFTELKTELDKNTKLKTDLIIMDPDAPAYSLNYHLFFTSFNLKEIYDQTTNLLIEIEKEVYKKILKQVLNKAIDVL